MITDPTSPSPRASADNNNTEPDRALCCCFSHNSTSTDMGGRLRRTWCGADAAPPASPTTPSPASPTPQCHPRLPPSAGTEHAEGRDRTPADPALALSLLAADLADARDALATALPLLAAPWPWLSALRSLATQLALLQQRLSHLATHLHHTDDHDDSAGPANGDAPPAA